jgi:cbb3-type cytochrome oxidase maturation protein
MNSPLEGQTFLFMWIGFLLLMSCGVAAFFLWGIRAGQFSDQDRARYLPLNSGIPPEEETPREQDREQGGRQRP